MLTPDEISRRLTEVRDRIAAATQRSGRATGSVRLVLASKTQDAAIVRAAYNAGARDFGENYVQEAAAKRAQLTDLLGTTWHLIGHLQANKAKLATRTFDVIQTLDSIRLAHAIARTQPSAPVRVLIEVNIGGEKSKSGVAASEVEALIESARWEVEIAGLMTIPPPTANATEARRSFIAMRELRDRLAASSGLALSELSMGMTEDFEVAIEEGATIVRVGRAVFGERNK
jgi:PLP dependent protein